MSARSTETFLTPPTLRKGHSVNAGARQLNRFGHMNEQTFHRSGNILPRHDLRVVAPYRAFTAPKSVLPASFFIPIRDYLNRIFDGVIEANGSLEIAA